MIYDFYLRAPGDPNYNPEQFLSTDQIENTVEQVRMTLLTRKGEVLGEPDFGLDVTKYLFEFEGFASLDTLQKEAHDQIGNYVMMSRIYEVVATPFNIDNDLDPFKVGLGLDIAINGRRSFATLYDS